MDTRVGDITRGCVVALVLAACGADDAEPAASTGELDSGATAGPTDSDSSDGPADGGESSADASDGAGETDDATTGDDTGGVPNATEPSRYPLELVSPRAAGSSPSPDAGTPPMPAGHRIFRAHPDLEYDIRAVVIGGAFPYTFSLSDAPEGMTIDADTGEIHWPDPSGTSVSPTITVVDAEGTEVSSPWTIEVTANGFRFVDAIAGDDGNSGTQDSPWRTLAAVHEGSSAGEIVYFRGGTYLTTGMPTSGSDTWVRVEFNGQVHAVQWIAYPEETPVIDNGYAPGVDNGRFIRLSGSDTHPVYLDGFEITGAWDKGLQFGSGTDYPVFRRLDIHDVAESIDGSNPAGIMTLASYADPSWYAAYQDIDFHDNASGGIKQYSHRKLLWEDLTFRDSGGGPDLKAHVPRFEVRRCAFLNNAEGYCGLFGNLAASAETGEAASGEIRYNRMLCGDAPTTWAMDVNQDGQAAEIHLYRNTFVGTVRVRNTDSDDGPFHFTHNVIVNSNEGSDNVTFEAVADESRVTFEDNLVGTPADGIVDDEGNLQGDWASHLGTRGHQIP
jgi:hypothetical protein